ncbi:MAG TPA: hypothetical protein VMS65_17730 [Polyangiaceae bacterium]|nr:hypothetical protein [Polyangiaceae bacterium]
MTACASGSSAPPETPSESASESPPASSAEPTPGESSKPTMESQREPFIQGCIEKAHSAQYCECGFQQFSEVFKDADLSAKLEPGDARLKTLHDKTLAACGGMLNEAQVKANFLDGCIEKDERKSAYCNCSWQAMRKNLDIADFLGDVEQPRFVEAKKKMVVTCKGKLPVEIPKSEFMIACSKGDTAREKPCACLWKKIKAKYSAEEIAAGTADVASVPGLAECNK